MLDYLKELLSSTANTAMQRVRNPALGAFALSWCAFNWKSIFYLFLSDTNIFDKISFISANSNWKIVFGYPCLSVVLICGFLPWVNNLISIWQAKPFDNNDSIENKRKAKQILRSTRLQRLQAKHDVTYDKVKTGAEKDIQTMKEQITESQERMGQLTAEKAKAVQDLLELSIKYDALLESSEKIKKEMINFDNLSKQRLSTINDLQDKISQLENTLMEANDASKKEASKTGLYRVIRSNGTYKNKE